MRRSNNFVKFLLAIMFTLIGFPALLYGQRPMVLTEDAQTLGRGSIAIGVGVEYFAKHAAPAPDLPESELRLAAFGSHFGVAENVDFVVHAALTTIGPGVVQAPIAVNECISYLACLATDGE